MLCPGCPAPAPSNIPASQGACSGMAPELPAQPYVAKGRLFLFVKCMAAPSFHTVKTRGTGPKISCCMIGSDARTSVNAAGAVKRNKLGYNSSTSIATAMWEQPSGCCSASNDTKHPLSQVRCKFTHGSISSARAPKGGERGMRAPPSTGCAGPPAR